MHTSFSLCVPSPDWVKEHPAYKNIKPMSSDQAAAIAGDDWMLRAMIQMFGTDSPKIRQAIFLARAQTDKDVYGPQIDAIEEEGARRRAQVADMQKSLQEMRERDARREQEKDSRPSIVEWRRMVSHFASILW